MRDQGRHLDVHDDDFCVMCETRAEETIEHLFFTCPFASQCWASLNFVWDHSLNLQDRFIQARQAHGHCFFTEASMIAAWEIWKMRNDKVFERRVPSHATWLCNFKNQCLVQSVRFKADLRSAFCFWLNAFS